MHHTMLHYMLTGAVPHTMAVLCYSLKMQLSCGVHTHARHVLHMSDAGAEHSLLPSTKASTDEITSAEDKACKTDEPQQSSSNKRLYSSSLSEQ